MIHKTTRSILSVLLAALLLVASTPLTPAFAGVGEAVSLQSESGESEGLKPAADGKYYISTAEQLRKFAKLVNDGETTANAVLTDDINLSDKSWTPIGRDSFNPYSGTFNGDGHTISGLYINDSSADYQGLFGYVSGSGKIENLSVSGSVSGNNYVGGVVGYNSGSVGYNSSGTVTNCAFSGNVSGDAYVGGVVGDNSASVTNCYNIGDVSGNIGVGGVVGDNGGNVENCYNTGAVNSSGNTVGGVVGYNSSSSTVENCYNTGTVTGPDSVNGETIVNVGGVVGSNSFKATVTNCYNTGSVTSSGNSVGGVVGYNYSGGSVTNSYNTSSVKGDWYVGGVVGSNSFSATVTNCYNTGTVTGTGYFVGGVVGYNSGPVENCYNTGKVSGPDSGNGNSVGGVVGYNSSSGNVKNCYNTGKVSGPDSGSDNNVGGVAGYNYGSVTNCYNTGTVTGTDDSVGGVVGNNDGGRVENCYNTGEVSGNRYVGGVVGLNGSSDNVTNCYFLQQNGEPAHGIGGDGGSDENAAPVTNLDTLCEKFKNDTTDTWSIHPVLGRPVLNENKEGGDGTKEHPYEIKTTDQLETFRDLVNGANDQTADPDAHAKLMNNIDLSSVCGAELNGGTSWTPIGNDAHQYIGTFDGNGKTIKNLYINNTTSYEDQGLFGYLGTSGDNKGTVQNLTVEGSVSSTVANSNVGGVVGLNSGNVENCYNTGEVSGNNCVGGVVGVNRGTVKNCYNTGTVTGTDDYVGGVVGYNISGSVTGCYFLQQNGVPEQGFGEGSGDATAKDDTAFHSGEVAWRLQDGQTAGEGGVVPLVWGQSNLTTPDSWPTLIALDNSAQPVYKVTVVYGDYADAPETETSYTNNPATPSETPSREGYTFDSWQKTTGEGNTITYTAKWTAIPATYTVTFDSQGGSAVSDQTVTEGQTITEPAAPTRDGYTFNGWFTETSGGSQWNFNDPVNKSMTLYAQWTEITPDPEPTPTPTPDPTPSGPSTGDSTGWDDILDELENTAKGDQITIDMGDETKVPAEIFESLAGKDVEISFDLGDIQWSASGADIPTDTDFTDLDLGVNLDTSGIPVNVINTITGEVGTVQITLAHDGEFGFTMTLTAPLGKENAGYWANLYHYDEEAEKLNFEAAAEIDEDGNVKIPFTHASQYAIVIDTHSHATVDVSDLFIDVAPNAWYKDAVQYAYDNGLMTGTSANEFAPEATTTRAMIVSILARLEGVESAQAAGFADVDDNDWYATAVNWAANVGVVNGYEDNTFRPNQPITREQLAAILMNYAAYKGYDVSARADLSHYSDADSISSWANDVLLWAVAEGLLTGVTDDTIAPQAHATRAQVAAILQRFLSE